MKDNRKKRLATDKLVIRRYQEGDSLDSILRLVNAAYQLEVGDRGLAFKRQDRLASVAELRPEQLHLAVVDSTIAGIVNIRPRPDNPAVADIGDTTRAWNKGYPKVLHFYLLWGQRLGQGPFCIVS